MDDDVVREQLLVISGAVRAIKQADNSWNTPHVDDKDYHLDIIEAESTGIHTGFMDEFGYWIYDEDTWPSHPLLVRRREKM